MIKATGFQKILALGILTGAMLLPMRVNATTIENVELDPVTGERIQETEDEDDYQAYSQYITYDCAYDSATGQYAFQVNGVSGVVISSVADGMVVTQPVFFQVQDGYTYVLYRNGVEYVPEGDAISDEGNYVVSISTTTGEQERPLSFTIIGEVSGVVRNYSMPDGFMIRQVTLNGERVMTDSYNVNFDEEGSYVVDYYCSVTDVAYELAFETDFTAPTLALPGVVDGKIHGPVDLSDIEPGSSVYLTRDGKQIDFSTTLTESGRYQITVMDKAGNSNTYSFTIMLYFNADTIALLIAFIAFIVGFGIYLYRASRKMRVR